MIVTFEGRSVSIEEMTREELLRYGSQGHVEDIQVCCEMFRRERLKPKRRFLQRVPDNVVPFPRQRKSAGSNNGGVA